MIVPDLSNLWLSAGLGFVMGFRHAADPDHVAAVSTIVARGRRFSSAWLVGAAWGLGHTATLVAAGTAVLLMQRAIPEAWATGLERAVGGMLVFLGVLAVAGRAGPSEHRHAHAHGSDGHEHHASGGHGEHSHPHVHVPELEALARSERPRLWRSFAVGAVHGLAGSSAVSLALLAAMPGAAAGAAYLVVFGLGTLAGMSLLSALFVFSLARLRSVWGLDRWLAPGIGVVSMAIGLRMLAGGAP
ncbi:MAG: sulfite exporter TauE/SafE family protein [Elusimicrobia bacterium]|nr:sulfite exporter TauE/SafE family protein [Elusimicrobiota bacterium]